MVDVVSRRCEHEGCDTHPSYGYPGRSVAFCAVHKQPGNIRYSKRKCVETGCKAGALYGHTEPRHCEDHADVATERNLVERACPSCGLTMLLDVHSGKCEYCDPTAQRTGRLAKQRKVKSWVDTGLPGVKYDYDCMVDGSSVCGRERPDFLFDAGSHRVILEVDENQHRERPCECEQIRMVNISQSLGCRTVFIRYNPDTFKRGLASGKLGTSTDVGDSERRSLLLCLLGDVLSPFPACFSSPSAGTDAYCVAYYLYFDGHVLNGGSGECIRVC